MKMQSNLKSIIFSIVIAGLLVSVIPFEALAQTAPKAGGIQNPLGGGPDQTITSVLKGIINWMLGLVGVIALIALISAGARMIFGFVDEDQVKKAKTTILWAVIGLAVVILSYAIINIVTTEILGAGSGSASGGSYDSSSGNITPNNINTSGSLPNSL